MSQLGFLVIISLLIAAMVLLQEWEESRKTPVETLAFRCARDPANLPSPPPGPDGRKSNYLHTCGNRIYDSQGREVKITGINWSGMEYGDCAPGGLGARNWKDLLDQIAELGYNTLRIPFSNEALDPKRKISGVNFDLNPDLRGLSGQEMLDRIVSGARERGLKVILDRHRPTIGGYSPLWYNSEVPEEKWIADWRMLAARYYGNDTVIGVDLHNEPRGATSWGSGDPATDWRLAVERAGDAVLEENPYLLIFVEGIENYRGDHYWWGGDLQGVRTDPVRLKVPNRVVYSPHDYGPAISAQAYFWDPTFPDNLPQEWDRRWGYIHKEGIAPVVVGEFGGWSVGNDPDGKWQTTLLSYLQANDIGALVWSVNPNWDTGGVLAGDWKTVERYKQDAYATILAPPLDVGVLGVFGKAPSQQKVFYRQGQDSPQGNRTAFSFQIMNDGPETLDLSRCEVRYWFQSGSLNSTEMVAEVDSLEPPAKYVYVDAIESDTEGKGDYLRIRFAPGAGTIERYRTSREIGIRFPKAGWPGHNHLLDYSYNRVLESRERFMEWERVTLYFDGKLAWGSEP